MQALARSPLQSRDQTAPAPLATSYTRLRSTRPRWTNPTPSRFARQAVMVSHGMHPALRKHGVPGRPAYIHPPPDCQNGPVGLNRHTAIPADAASHRGRTWRGCVFQQLPLAQGGINGGTFGHGGGFRATPRRLRVAWPQLPIQAGWGYSRTAKPRLIWPLSTMPWVAH